MYDLHVHVLPGIDDGPEDEETSLKMIEKACLHGTKVLLATPHRKDVTEDSSVPNIRKLLSKLNDECGDIDINLLLGMENHLDVQLPDDLEKGIALSMNDSRYVLIEMPFWGCPDFVEPTLKIIQSRGFVPVLAHPERIEAFQKNVELLDRFIKSGMLSQITGGSLLGYWGEEVRKFTEELVNTRLVHIMASDAHTVDGPREPLLGPAVKTIASMIGERNAHLMVAGIPFAILEDKPCDSMIDALRES